LTDGLTVVKGEKFNNWRTVGNAVAIAQLFSKRNVDELIVLDVNCRVNKTHVDLRMIEEFSSILEIPFSVGGGINSIEDARACIRAGAEKIVLGTAAIKNPEMITKIANEFGNQAVVVSVDVASNLEDFVYINSGKTISSEIASDFISNLEELGAGEILLQSIERDGTLVGMDADVITKALNLTSLPVVASGGASSLADFEAIALLGVSGIAAGAIFQFTQITPNQVREHLSNVGIAVRRI